MPQMDEDPTPDELILEEVVATYSAAFDKLCLERHRKGQVEYGNFTFIQNDIVRMMMEELADTTNYCRMQFIKLMMLQRALEEDLEGKDELVSRQMGVGAFKGTGEVGWDKG